MILACEMCWAQKMPRIYPAVRSESGPVWKQKARRYQGFLSASTTNVSDNFSWHFGLLSPLWWKIAHSVQSVNSFVDIKWKLTKSLRCRLISEMVVDKGIVTSEKYNTTAITPHSNSSCEELRCGQLFFLTLVVSGWERIRPEKQNKNSGSFGLQRVLYCQAGAMHLTGSPTVLSSSICQPAQVGQKRRYNNMTALESNSYGSLWWNEDTRTHSPELTQHLKNAEVLELRRKRDIMAF